MKHELLIDVTLREGERLELVTLTVFLSFCIFALLINC